MTDNSRKPKIVITVKKHVQTRHVYGTHSDPKPVLKWIGGKSQILEQVLNRFPSKMDNYHEIFLGGGSVLIGLLQAINKGKITVKHTIYAHDINHALISMYTNIQKHHVELFEQMEKLISDFSECTNETINRDPETLEEAKSSQESYYYWIRKQYNDLSNVDKCTIYGSCCFIFLNKTCFRGLYRIGPHGFNVPYGHYKNPTILDWDNLNELHNLIQNVEFKCLDFKESLKCVTKNDFVYLDPPYVPVNATSFVKYTENGFNMDQHQQLFEILNNLPCRFLLSNSDTKLVRQSFIGNIFSIDELECRRAINSKKPDSKANELFVKNY